MVLATNIAETSLLDNIIYVTSTRVQQAEIINARTGMESLIVTPVSKEGERQPAGGEGRQSGGG